MNVDPITLGVIWGALSSIAVEIGTTVHKTAYSEQAREGQDFSVAVFDRRVLVSAKNMNITPVRTGFRSPWQNGVAERWVGSCRRELLDQIIPLN